MDERLNDLYYAPRQYLPQDVYLQELAEQCARLEERVRALAEKLSENDRQLLEGYLDLRDELEYQSVKTALRFSKYVK
jgi:hypothetical protein